MTTATRMGLDSPSRTAQERRPRRSRSSLRKTLGRITPLAVVVSAFVMATGFGVGLAVLGSVVGLLITNMVYVGIIVAQFIYIARTGPYWNVPFAAHPARPRAGR